MTQPDPRPWWRRLFCWGWCPCEPYEDEGGVGGRCIQCGRLVGFVTREQLRELAQRDVEMTRR